MNASKLKSFVALSVLLVFLFTSPTAQARLIFADDVFVNDSETFRIGDDDDSTSTNLSLDFGGSNTETLLWDYSNSRFDFSDDLRVNGNQATIGQGYVAADHSASDSDGVINLGLNSSAWENISWDDSDDEFDFSDDVNVAGSITASASGSIVASGSVTAGGSLSANGTVTLGDGEDNVTINSNVWDISSGGSVTGLTGIVSSGTMQSNGTLDANGTVTLGDGGDNVTINSNVWDISSAGAVTGLTGIVSSGTMQSNGTLDANGTVTLGDGGDSVTIDSSVWDITSGGSVTGLTGIVSSGTMQSNGTLDANGTVTLGDGGDNVTINSNVWDITSAGIASGLTGITSSGDITFSSASQFRIRENSNPASNSACGTLNELILDTSDDEVQICTATGSAGAATWEKIGAKAYAPYTVVYSSTSPTSWTDLDLSSVVGSQTTLVTLGFFSFSDMNAIAIRRNGESWDYYSATHDETASGIALGHHDNAYELALQTYTSTTGVIEWRTETAQTASVRVLGYIN